MKAINHMEWKDKRIKECGHIIDVKIVDRLGFFQVNVSQLFYSNIKRKYAKNIADGFLFGYIHVYLYH